MPMTKSAQTPLPLQLTIVGPHEVQLPQKQVVLTVTVNGTNSECQLMMEIREETGTKMEEAIASWGERLNLQICRI
jgi:metal-sulfur cluster biosynthetic enzyme